MQKPLTAKERKESNFLTLPPTIAGLIPIFSSGNNIRQTWNVYLICGRENFLSSKLNSSDDVGTNSRNKTFSIQQNFSWPLSMMLCYFMLFCNQTLRAMLENEGWGWLKSWSRSNKRNSSLEMHYSRSWAHFCHIVIMR